MARHEAESRIDRFYRMFGKDYKVANYYKLENDVKRIFDMIDDIERRVSKIEANRKKQGRTKSENAKARDSLIECLCAMEADGMAGFESFENMDTSDATMRVFTYSDIKGLGVDKTRGNRTMLTRIIRDRYGFTIENHKLVAGGGIGDGDDED